VQLRFRHRIALLVALAAFGLVAATAITILLGRRSDRQLSGIETRYVPLLDLDHELTSLFAKITKALEDAASAAEETRLADADTLVATLRERLETGAKTIAHNGGDARQLSAGLQTYYQIARKVAQAMVEGANVAELAESIQAMRAAQLSFEASLKAATSPDRSRLAAAFKGARAAQREALIGYIIVAIAILLVMILVSWRIIRRMNESLQAVSDGVERLASGEFGEEIAVTSEDEIGDVAREANRTAGRLRKYREELEARTEEVAQASRYKSEFLASMSHELRTPLNSIMILSNVLSANDGKNLTAKQVEYSTLISRSGEELLGLINEVLDLAKIEAGKQALECTMLTLREVEDYIRRMFTPIAAQKGLTFEIELGDVPATVRTDRMRLNQIVKNLIANAVKFTQRGGVSVRIARPDPGAFPNIEDAYTIEVNDTGIGIPAEKLSQIFEAFTQAETGTSRKFGGTGLGLTIAKQLAGLLGGELHVESTQGAGSKFTLVLPSAGPRDDKASVEPSTAGPRAIVADVPKAPASEPASLAGRTVLVVDDDMRNLYALSSSLRERDVDVVGVSSGSEALETLSGDRDFDAILVDVMMPGLDGYETIRKIRSQDRFHTLPIIVLTAGMIEDERVRCKEAGANECLTKPLDLAQLTATIAALVKQPASSDQES
jgi:signal transduction histidine kinase/ActR/RegA family two-component response regulator